MKRGIIELWYEIVQKDHKRLFKCFDGQILIISELFISFLKMRKNGFCALCRRHIKQKLGLLACVQVSTLLMYNKVIPITRKKRVLYITKVKVPLLL